MLMGMNIPVKGHSRSRTARTIVGRKVTKHVMALELLARFAPDFVLIAWEATGQQDSQKCVQMGHVALGPIQIRPYVSILCPYNRS